MCGSTNLISLGSKEVANTFRWRPSREAPIAIADMVDRHLFFTVRMIWNNFMPEEARVGEVRLYNFGPSYTREYMADAIRAMVPEPERREKNLPEEWKVQLAAMRSWFLKPFVPASIKVERALQ